MLTNRIAFKLSIILLCFIGNMKAQHLLSSPDGRTQFVFSQNDKHMTYSIKHNGKTIIENGQLGIQVDNHLTELAMGIPLDSAELWTDNMQLTSVEQSETDSVWKPIYGENSAVRDNYRQMTLHFVKGENIGNNEGGYDKKKSYLMDIIVRAYNEGIAFRYHLPEATNGLFMHITDELTSFPMPENTLAWHETWAQGPYNITPLEKWSDESERPLLLKLPNGKWVALLEATLTDFPRGKFRLEQPGCIKMSLHSDADVITPYDMPWRVIMIADKPVQLINNNSIILNLNQPQADIDFSFVKPGKAFRSTRLDRENIIKSIDFCADFGIQYVELDAGWYGPEMKIESDATKVAENRDFSMTEVCEYAHEKGVGVWLYVNQRALTLQLDSILPTFRKWGVSGIKFGFVQVGSQHWTTWLHQAVRKCAEYGIMVDIHDEYRPTGLSRTLPNLLTQEGIRGNEEMPDATHNVTLPFTRFICGPADYTLCYFNGRVKCTRAHQLAMAAVYYSPLQFLFWYDLPEAYKGEPELQFWKDIPTTFQQSIAIDGMPGEFIVQARRSGNKWFVGAMTNNQPRDISIPTSFLPNGSYKAVIFIDNPEKDEKQPVISYSIDIAPSQTINLHLQPSGGAAITIIPSVNRKS